MKLIFEAIKSLLRGVSSAIEQTAQALSKRIDKVQSTADTAKKNAAKAQVAAGEAQAKAEEAKATAKVHADWNESDPTSLAYVENRTHYSENYMRELEPVEYGPIARSGYVYIGASNLDLVQALQGGLENVTVEYRFAPDATWEVARGSVWTVSAMDVRYSYQDQSGASIFYYSKNSAMFLNNFSTSKDNLYIRVSGVVPDVRYSPLRREFLPSDLLSSVDESVRYTAQTLTDEQKALARSNIGAMGSYLTVTVSRSGNDYFTDKSFQDVADAHAAGRRVIALWDSKTLDLSYVSARLMQFTCFDSSTGRLVSLLMSINGDVNVSYEFVVVTGINGMRGEVTFDGPSAGLLPAPNVGTVAAGKYIRIFSAGSDGKVYQTEAVDAPSGGGWKTVVDYTLTEGATDIIVDADANGNPFSLVFAAFAIFVPANPENTAAATSYWWYFDSSNTSAFRAIGSIAGSQTNDRYIVGNVSTYGEGHKSAVTSIQGSGNFGPQDGSYLDEYFSYLRIVSKTDGNFFPVGTRVVIAGIPVDGGDGE